MPFQEQYSALLYQMDKKYNNFNKLLKYITYYSYVLCSDFKHVRVHISLKILFLRCQ